MRNQFVVLDSMLTAVLFLATLSPVFASAQDTTTQPDLRRADEYLASRAVQGAFRGSVLVGMDGKVVFEKGYGFADQEWNARNSPTTKFRIASLTKQFTAACILLLQEHGQLSASDPVSKYVSDLPETWQPITLHQLLTHTSGIPNYPSMPRVESELNRTGATPRELLTVAATKPLEFKPGTHLHYTNTGYVLLGMVIEKVSGLSYADFLQVNVFTPLGMKHSGYDRAATILSERASGYMIRDGNVTNADFIDMSIPYASGSIYSTVEDMYRWNEALATPGKFLTARSLEQMFAVYPETLLDGMHYGYGVVIAQRYGKQLYYHGGGVKGFESVIQRYPKERVCIIVLENLDPSRPWDLADHIASNLFDQLSPREQ
jgi:CubicO group peptidase (beta-lactamase class C family)